MGVLSGSPLTDWVVYQMFQGFLEVWEEEGLERPAVVRGASEKFRKFRGLLKYLNYFDFPSRVSGEVDAIQ